jgi:hypothetical protein
MRCPRARVLCAALALLAARPSAALAAGSAADRDAARTLAGQGYDAFEARDYQRTLDLFRQAEARYHAPPHLLYIARAQIKLGKLLDAEATYQRIVDEKLAPDAPAPFKEAQATARAEIAGAHAVVPVLIVTVAGVPPPGTRVLLDGQPLGPDEMGQPLRRDPGEHAIVLEVPGPTPGLSMERRVTLKPGAEAQVVLPLAAPPLPSVVPGAVLVGVGGAGLVLGTVAAVLLRSTASSRATPLRVTEITAFAVGGAAAATGAVLLVLRARAAPQAAALPQVQVGVGAGSVSIAGQF